MEIFKLLDFQSTLKPTWNDTHTIVLENANFFWRNADLGELKKMWKNNYSISYMNDYFNRSDPDEIFLALLHLSRMNQIGKRKSGLFEGIR